MPAVIPRGVTLLIADSSRTGGPEHVLTLAGRLGAEGWEPTVVCPPGSLVDRCRERHLPVVALPMAGRSIAVAAPRLRRVVRRLRPGMLHTHGLRAGALALAARPDTVAWVHTAHLDDWYVPSLPRRFVHRRLARAVARRADRQIAVSASVATFLRQRVGVAGARVVTIPNGIEPLGRCSGPAPAGRRVGLLASLVPSKGVDVALRAVASEAGRG
ncbi:MAG TPA: glycosyltransferase, partial [Candidatus Dormibacteraeota bacterium]|nr:glycosyltransferase [Candidatus Dormibacteraeota bacterium]